MKLRVILAVFSVFSVSNGLKCATKVNWKHLTSNGTSEEVRGSCAVSFRRHFREGDVLLCHRVHKKQLFTVKSHYMDRKFDDDYILVTIRNVPISIKRILSITMYCNYDMCNSLDFAANITKAVERANMKLGPGTEESIHQHLLKKGCHLDHLAKTLETRYNEKFQALTTEKPAEATSPTTTTGEMTTTKEASTEAPSTSTNDTFGGDGMQTDGTEPETPTAADPQTATSEFERSSTSSKAESEDTTVIMTGATDEVPTTSDTEENDGWRGFYGSLRTTNDESTSESVTSEIMTTTKSLETGTEETEQDTSSERATETTVVNESSAVPRDSTDTKDEVTETTPKKIESPDVATSDTSAGDAGPTTSVEGSSGIVTTTDPTEAFVETTTVEKENESTVPNVSEESESAQATTVAESPITTEEAGPNVMTSESREDEGHSTKSAEESRDTTSTSTDPSNAQVTESNEVAEGTSETDRDEDQSVQNDNPKPEASASHGDLSTKHHDLAMMLLIALTSTMTLMSGLAAVIVFKMKSMLE